MREVAVGAPAALEAYGVAAEDRLLEGDPDFGVAYRCLTYDVRLEKKENGAKR